MNTLSKAEKTRILTEWCREQGIKSADLGCSTVMTEDGRLRPYQNAHPAIDDVIILLRLKKEFWSVYRRDQKTLYSNLWNYAYVKQMPFKANHLRQVESLYNTGIWRIQDRQKQKLKAQRIMAQRRQLLTHQE
jgi:hypothetical protein